MHQFLSEMIFMSEEKLVPKLRFPDFEHNWESKKLKDLSNIQRGASPRPITAKKWYDNENKKVGWVRIGDVTSSSKYLTKTEDYFSEEGVKKSRFLPKGSLIMSICATIGKPIVTGMDTCIHDGFVGFSELKNINKEFLYYYLNILEPKFISLSQTGSQANLNSDLVRNAEIGVPSIQEQEKIVNFISAVDKKHNILNKNLETQLSFKRYLMQQIFTQKLRFADSDSCWKEISLKDIGTFYRGHSYNSTNVADEGLLVLRSNNIQGNVLDFSEDGLQFVDKDCKKELELQKNDIVICMSNGTRRLVGKSAEYTGNYENKVTVGAFCSIFRTKNKLAKYLFQTESYKKNLYLILAGTNINNLKNSDLEKFKFNIPTNESEINKIHDLFVSIDNKIDYNKKQLEEITLFKKGLLQQMFV